MSMTRRSLLRFLGLAPVLAPVVVEAVATSPVTVTVHTSLPKGTLITVGERGAGETIIPLDYLPRLNFRGSGRSRVIEIHVRQVA